MKERPILFNGAMVRAILEGRKTVTRRALNAQALKNIGYGAQLGECHELPDEGQLHPNSVGYYKDFCPYGQPGDRLWVREAWQLHEKFTDNCVAVYKANERNSWTEFHRRFPVEVARGCQAKPFQTHGFRPSIHMPRWACRILLEITDVRIERLQEISREQCIAEGPELPAADHLERAWHVQFQRLWESTGGDWDGNPWVWVVEFKRVTP